MTEPLLTLMVSRLEIGGTLAKWKLQVTIGQPPKEFLLYDYPHRKKGLHYHLAWKPKSPWEPIPGDPDSLHDALDLALDHLEENLVDLVETHGLA